MEASILDLGKKMREVMAAIDRHERVILTRRGRRYAEIVSLDEVETRKIRVADLPAFGMWAGRTDMIDPVAYVSEIRPKKLLQMK